MAKKQHAYTMQAKTSEENIHVTRYLQAKPLVVADPDVLLCFPTFPIPYFSKSQVNPTPPRMVQENLNVQEYMRERIK